MIALIGRRIEVCTFCLIGLFAVFADVPAGASSGSEESRGAPASVAFAPTIPNKAPAPRSRPEGMVWIPGGEFSMGAAVGGEGSHAMPMGSNDSQPMHRVYVDGFWMDA